MCVCLTALCGCRSLRSLLDGEMEYSAGLRQETDSLGRRLEELEERHTVKVQALARFGRRTQAHINTHTFIPI